MTTILVVEDSLTQAARLQHVLEQEDFVVSTAHDGAQGFAVAKETMPALIISDVMMPVMDGYEFCRRAKADHQLREIPILLLTSLAGPQDIVRALQAGADNFVTKPCEDDDLLQHIRCVLANREMRETHGAGIGIEFFVAGERYFLDASRIQIVGLLLSLFQTPVEKNQELAGKDWQLGDSPNKMTVVESDYRELLEADPDGIVEFVSNWGEGANDG
jgi:two-component system, cell cycle response regulator